MRVLQIVPDAFDYFDDIYEQAFQQVERLIDYGILSEVNTLQYNQPSQSKKQSVQQITKPATNIESKPKKKPYNYHGQKPTHNFISSLSDYDLIHLHAPFLGLAGKIYQWKLANKKIPLVVSYYRPVKVKDLLSVFIRLYNKYYLPKIIYLADAVLAFPQTYNEYDFPKLSVDKLVNITSDGDVKNEDIIKMDLTYHTNRVKLYKDLQADFSVSKLVSVYNLLVNKK